MTRFVDPKSFGDSRGAQILCEILNKYRRLIRNRMTTIIQELINELNELDHVPQAYYQMLWLGRIRKAYLEKIAHHKHLTAEMKDFGPNVVVTLCRERERRYTGKPSKSGRKTNEI